MPYQEFADKNKANEQNYKRMMKQSQVVPAQFNQNPYLRFSIERVDMSNGNGVVEIASKTQNVNTTEFVHRIVSWIMNSNCAHVTNPSRIKSWRVFQG